MNDKEQSTNLGTVLRKWRVLSERTLRDVAAEIGIAHGTLSRIERGEGFDADTWLKLQVWLFAKSKGENLDRNGAGQNAG